MWADFTLLFKTRDEHLIFLSVLPNRKMTYLLVCKDRWEVDDELAHRS